MKKITIFLLLSIILFLPFLLSAQNRILITGEVTDSDARPLVNANIVIIDDSLGCTSNSQGHYVLTLPAYYDGKEVILKVQYVGYGEQTKKIKISEGINKHNFQLQSTFLKIKPIIVTAQRREENLQNVPVAITAMENKDLHNRGIDRVIDLQNSVPNFYFGSGTFNTRSSSSIRGIAGATFTSGIETRATYYVDDVYLGRPAAVNMDLFDVERIEILKGSQGTLFGKNTVSGVVNITTSKPTNLWVGSVSVDAGNLNYLNSIIILNAPVIENKLFTRFSGKIIRRDGYVTNLYSGKDLNGQNILTGRFKIRYLPSPNLDINFSINALQDRRDNRTHGIALDGPGYDAAPGPRQVSHNLDEFEYRDIFGSALNMVYRFSNNYSIKSISAFTKIKNRGNLDEDLSPINGPGTNWLYKEAHFTQEFRLISPHLKHFNFVSGLFYFYQNADFIFSSITPDDCPDSLDVPGWILTSDGPVRTNSIAGYFHGNLNIKSDLLLFGGLRYTYEYKSLNWNQFDNQDFFVNVSNFRDTYSKGVFSPQIGLQYHPLDHLMLYAKTSWGYKSGGWGNFTVWKKDYLKLDPEYCISYESGVKFSTFNNRLYINTAVFLSEFDDFQTEIWQPLPPPVEWQSLPVYTNAAKVTSKGIELEATAALLKNLSFSAAFGYVDATYDKFIVASDSNYTGNKLEFAPEIEYNFSAEYKIPVINIGTFSIRGDFSHKDDHYSTASNTKDYLVEGYELLNGKIGFTSSNGLIEISLWGKNLTDELYMLNRGKYPIGFRYVWYGMPRTFGIQLSYNFLRYQ